MEMTSGSLDRTRCCYLAGESLVKAPNNAQCCKMIFRFFLFDCSTSRTDFTLCFVCELQMINVECLRLCCSRFDLRFYVFPWFFAIFFFVTRAIATNRINRNVRITVQFATFNVCKNEIKSSRSLIFGCFLYFKKDFCCFEDLFRYFFPLDFPLNFSFLWYLVHLVQLCLQH